ncbi:MAG TPA: hypothetical protein VGZ73_17655 [Bryobacteraceae bacterium]|jgi:hypothetical protein|nr:hypothetical protein [Bryobacteraceae bacterium]
MPRENDKSFALGTAGQIPTDNFLQAAYIRRLIWRTDVSENVDVKGAEFERRVQKFARRKRVTSQFVADKGKGSHGRLYYGEEFTTLKDRKKEIGRDLLAKMCRDLNIDPHEL